jgi:hypothetical protein
LLDEFSGEIGQLRIMMAEFFGEALGENAGQRDPEDIRRQLTGWLPPRERRTDQVHAEVRRKNLACE